MIFLKLLLITSVGLFTAHSALALDFSNAVPNELIIKYKNESLNGLLQSKAGSNSGLKLKKSWKSLGLHHFSTKKNQDLSELVENLNKDPNVEFVEPNYYVRSSNFVMSSAPIRVTQAWTQLSTPGAVADLPIIAIVDSGLDLNHQVFNNSSRVHININEIPGNGFDDDGNGYVDDVSGWNFINNTPNISDSTGHGTHVAGIALGVTEDVVDFNPANSPRVQILPLKFLNQEGVGKTSDAIEAITYAISAGAKVINNSWGGPSYSATLHSVLNQAYLQGITIVVAAGNESSDNDSDPIYPASLDIPSLISVAASSDSDNFASFSNYGQNTVHVFAPGVGVLSTIPGNNFGVSSGTSMAAPFVSGLAALISFEAPQLTGFQIKNLIVDNGDYRAWLQNYISSGRRIQFERTVVAAQSEVDTPSFQPQYSPNYSLSSRGLASSSTSSSSLGCASVTRVYQEQNEKWTKPKKGSSPSQIIFLMIPLMFVLRKKLKLHITESRRYERRVVNFKGQMVTGDGLVLPIKIKDLSSHGAGIQLLSFYAELKFSDLSKDVIINIIDHKLSKKSYKASVKRSSKTGFLGLEFKS